MKEPEITGYTRIILARLDTFSNGGVNSACKSIWVIISDELQRKTG